MYDESPYLVVADGLILHPATPEARLLTKLAADDPQTLWLLVAEQLEQDNWRLAMSIRGWLTDSLPVDVLIRWVAGRIDRARLVARIAAVGKDRLSPLATVLLTEFGTDDEVQNALSADFVSGGWVGPWSGRIRHQLDHPRHLGRARSPRWRPFLDRSDEETAQRRTAQDRRAGS